MSRFNDILLPIKYKQYILSEDQIRNAFTTPITIIPAPNLNTLIYPLVALMNREAGAAYTGGAATALQLRWITDAVVVSAPLAVGQFTSGAADTHLGILANNGGTTIYSNPGVSQRIGSGIEAFMAGGNVSGGSGRVFIQIIYMIIPLNFQYNASI